MKEKKYTEFEFVEGKGYFSGYLCKHCNNPSEVHLDNRAFSDDHQLICPDDLRKRFPSVTKTSYLEDESKPIFKKILI